MSKSDKHTELEDRIHKMLLYGLSRKTSATLATQITALIMEEVRAANELADRYARTIALMADGVPYDEANQLTKEAI